MQKNEFEKYKHFGYIDFAELGQTEYFSVFQNGQEAIAICVRGSKNNKYVYGYDIFFNDGRQVTRRPGELEGWFDSSKNAQLHALSHMIANKKFFSMSALAAIKKRVVFLMQDSLFPKLS